MRIKTLFRLPTLATAARAGAAALIVAGSLIAVIPDADARAGGGRSMGSRGARTWSAPAPTPTAPSAQTMQRSATQPGATNPGVPNAGMAAPARQGGFFNRPGFMGGLMGGLLGAGLFGLLMGGGFFSGLGSLAGILGLLLQVALIFIVVRLAMRWFASRNSPATAQGPQSGPQPGAPLARDMFGGGSSAPASNAAAAGRSGFASRPRGRPLQLQGSDFDAFERKLAEVQDAYSRDDRATLSQLMTPEMLGYVAEELDGYAQDGLQNRLGEVKLLQGDLSEAWSEDGRDFATVAMRYQLKDTVIERASGRLVQGDPDRLESVVEFWTFTRPAGGGEWTVSAIQQGG
ncbi:putative lipid-binding transport protein (Tim44 family) [Ancylobacter sp. 3268]|uniref:TIM44-like domain-containing protein n=1 Tax=Ancylobacter sp. 3268 TaxID=2817752 RepID=UPI00285969CA|nr:TIM44-like domain-containing protein [Ancylobacter sp. 3268]MDR6951770.1 putative lipid-binding transport protein (Tim44 family) [Ancylobacter sp. 3268]